MKLCDTVYVDEESDGVNGDNGDNGETDPDPIDPGDPDEEGGLGRMLALGGALGAGVLALSSRGDSEE